MQKIVTAGLVAAGLCLAAAPASAGLLDWVAKNYPKITNGPPVR